MTPGAYVFGDRTYPIRLQFRFGQQASLPVCSKRRPCAVCYRRANR